MVRADRRRVGAGGGGIRPAGERPGAPARLDDDWRRWIAENLLIGAATDEILGRLVERGCPPALARAEIARAAADPYLRGAAVLQQRLAKRDWVLTSLGRLLREDEGWREIPRRHALAAEDFFRDFYALNRPVVMTGLIDDWPARTWTLDRLATLPGDPEIEVQMGREGHADYEARSDTLRHRQRLSAVLDRLRGGQPSNDYYVTANNGGHNRTALAPLWDEIGPLPGYLADGADQDGFFWMGPTGTVTPFHHDLTNNLLVQIMGRKRVTMIPAIDTPLMRNHLHCYSQWPGPEALATLPDGERPSLITVDLVPGDILFIPLGWWHHVVGLDTTISLSFTNFTRPNDYYSGYSTYGAM